VIGKILKDIYYPYSKKYKLDMENNRKYNDQLHEIFIQELKWRRELIVGEYYHYRTSISAASYYGNTSGGRYVKVVLKSIIQFEGRQTNKAFTHKYRYIFTVVKNSMEFKLLYTTVYKNILRFRPDDNIDDIRQQNNSVSIHHLISNKVYKAWKGAKIFTFMLKFNICSDLTKPTV
jgi:hypothetical protein